MREPSPQGLLIRRCREDRGWRRKELARRAQVSESTVKNAENGRHAPSRSTLAALSRALEVPELLTPQMPDIQRALLHATSPEALAELLKRYSVPAVAAALRLARLDLWRCSPGCSRQRRRWRRT